MYRFTATGIAPDSVSFNTRGEMFVYAPANLLRPETVESLFILWRVTKQRRWRAYGWQIFEAFVRHCRNARGFAGLQNVEVKKPKQKSRQESFWSACPSWHYSDTPRLESPSWAGLTCFSTALSFCVCVSVLRSRRDAQVSLSAFFRRRHHSTRRLCVQHGGAPAARLP